MILLFGTIKKITGEALGQVWLFIVAPIIGAAIAGATYKLLEPSVKAATREGFDQK